MTEELLLGRLLLSESEFNAEVAASTAALAVDMEAGKIVYATGEAERLFHCQVKNGLGGMFFEDLIPQELRAPHKLHVARYLESPRPRPMGGAAMSLRARSLDGDTFPAAITLLPIKKGERLYMILIFQPLPDALKEA